MKFRMPGGPILFYMAIGLFFGVGIMALIARLNYEDYDQVSYVNSIARDDLNGHSLNNVFRDNDIAFKDTSKVYFNQGTLYDYEYISQETYYFAESGEINENDLLYIYIKGKVIGGDGTGLSMSIRSYLDRVQVNTVMPNLLDANDLLETERSYMFDVGVANGLAIRGGGSLPINTYEFDYFIVNITYLGIDLTVEQMDYYYEMYIDGLDDPTIPNYLLDNSELTDWGTRLYTSSTAMLSSLLATVNTFKQFGFDAMIQFANYVINSLSNVITTMADILEQIKDFVSPITDFLRNFRNELFDKLTFWD